MDDSLADVVIPSRPCPPSRSTLVEWEAEADTLDHLHHRRQRDTSWPTLGVHERREYVVARARAGTSFDELAAELSVPVEEVVAPLLLANYTDAELERTLAVERTWRANPDWSAAAIQREAGLAFDSSGAAKLALRLIAKLGGTPGTVGRLRSGGGLRYTDEQYEEIRRLRDNGMPWRQIGKRTGIAYTTAMTMYRRRYGKVASDA